MAYVGKDLAGSRRCHAIESPLGFGPPPPFETESPRGDFVSNRNRTPTGYKSPPLFQRLGRKKTLPMKYCRGGDIISLTGGDFISNEIATRGL